ncbi:hypothetical protein ACKWTF_002053 [Chironomus riparius]
MEDLMKRMESHGGTVQGGMLVKGTLYAKGDEIIRTSFDDITSSSMAKYLDFLKDACENFVRERKSSDKLDFIRIDYKKRQVRDSRYQIMMAVEDDFKAVILQEYKVRDLRKRSSREEKETDEAAYKYTQKNYFFPSLDK